MHAMATHLLGFMPSICDIQRGAGGPRDRIGAGCPGAQLVRVVLNLPDVALHAREAMRLLCGAVDRERDGIIELACC